MSKIIPSNSKSLWTAVKIAKNLSFNSIPENLMVNGLLVPFESKADSFAKFFHNKINIIKRTCDIKNAVYNGNRKILVDNRFFMCESDIIECLDSVEPKNCEGFDRMPVRILSDANQFLVPPLTILFRKFTNKKQFLINGKWQK
jgi:hypothetical protein